MPITFGCGCGRQFAVAEEFAGKRTKCPACGSALTVPAAPAPDSPASGEDEAYRMLVEGAEESEPAPSAARRDPPPDDYSPRPAESSPVPVAPPKRKRGPRIATRRSRESGRSYGGGIHISPAVLGGFGSMALAAVWFGLGLAANRVFFYPPILFLFGFVAVVRGLLGYSEE